jgi:hypothetical protein
MVGVQVFRQFEQPKQDQQHWPGVGKTQVIQLVRTQQQTQRNQ